MILVGPGCNLLRFEPVEARMGPVVVIVVMPSCDDLAGVAVTPNRCSFRHSSLSRTLNDSTRPFRIGLPGAM